MSLSEDKRLGQKLEDLAKERGYPKLFGSTDHEQKGLEWVAEICDFIDENNRSPSCASKDPKEKRLGQKLSQLKRNIN